MVKQGYQGRALLEKKGFTLIELLVVIAIIGLLASIITVSLVSSRAKGRDARRVSDIKTIQLALETYYNDNASYPSAIYAAGQAPSVAFAPYMSTMPVDPKDNSTQYKYVSWNVNNEQICNGTAIHPYPIAYHLGAGLEDSNNQSLFQDRDLSPARSSISNCGTAVDFDGKGAISSNACSTTLGTDACYDVSNN